MQKQKGALNFLQVWSEDDKEGEKIVVMAIIIWWAVPGGVISKKR